MDAKDTVMIPEKLSEAIQYFPNWDLNRSNKFIEELCNYIAQRQAEISFKAGIKEVVEKLKGAMEGKTYWAKNCQQNRKRQCKCCQECPGLEIISRRGG